jgi:hypothetical protein
MTLVSVVLLVSWPASMISSRLSPSCSSVSLQHQHNAQTSHAAAAAHKVLFLFLQE